MRAAPPVGVKVQPGGAWLVFQGALAACAAAASGAWLALMAGAGPLAAALAAPILGAAAAAALVSAAPRRPQSLHWDGEHWSVDGTHGDMQVMIDLDRWMLLCLTPAPGQAARRARWLAVGAAAGAGAWHGLRAALHAGPAR